MGCIRYFCGYFATELQGIPVSEKKSPCSAADIVWTAGPVGPKNAMLMYVFWPASYQWSGPDFDQL